MLARILGTFANISFHTGEVDVTRLANQVHTCSTGNHMSRTTALVPLGCSFHSGNKQLKSGVFFDNFTVSIHI